MPPSNCSQMDYCTRSLLEARIKKKKSGPLTSDAEEARSRVGSDDVIAGCHRGERERVGNVSGMVTVASL